MSKRLKVFMILMAVAIFFIFTLGARADVAEPGSENDPLVTKSYVDKALFNLKQYVDSRSGDSASFEIVYLEQGQQLEIEWK